MALATQCPHCHTTFRVASDQLKLRGGIVRCGACNEVFDGNAALIDPAAAPASPAAPAGVRSDIRTFDASEEDGVRSDIRTFDAVEENGDHGARADISTPQVEPAAEHSASAAFDAQVAAIEAQLLANGEEPIYTLDFDTTFDPFGILPKPVPDEPEAEPQPDAAEEPDLFAEPLPSLVREADPEAGQEHEHDPVSEPEPEPALVHGTDVALEAAPGQAPVPEPAPQLPADLAPDSEPPAAAIPLAAPAFASGDPRDPRAPPLPMRASSAREHSEPRAMQQKLTPVVLPRSKTSRKPTRHKIDAQPKLRKPELDEPEFVRRGRQKEQTGRTLRIAMAIGSALLVLALAAQAVATFRNVLAAQFPSLRPALVSACSLLRCRVELPAQIETLGIETGELQSLGANTFSFTTLVRNQGSLVQAWPHIELTLTDANEKPLVRRVFKPAEYLPRDAAPAKGFAARSEQPVKLYFELKDIKASGYHIAIFYP